ncbi:MAG TPA: hypothetical protein VNO26_05250 [Candidatus Limnocylindria bacterium]|nr:hypothetical protein [Candidatus Limnocylindria bacterium]
MTSARERGGLGWSAWLALAVLTALPARAVAKQQFVYVHDRSAPGGIRAWAMDKDGRLTSVAGSPFVLVDQGGGCSGNCQTMAYSPKRKTLYTGGPTGVSAWTVAPNGSLTLVPGSPFSPGAGGDFLGTGVVEIGKRVFVYAASYADNNVYGWEAQPDGSLAELAASPFAAGVGPDGLAVRKKLVFVANEGDSGASPSSLSSYVAATDGTLVPAPGSPFTPNDVNFIYNLSPDARGKVVYADDFEVGIRAFAVDNKTAQLTEIAGSPFETVLGGLGVLVTKKLAYALSGFADDAFQPFAIGKKGVLTSTGIKGNAPLAVAAFAGDKSGKRLVFAGTDSIATATIDDKKEGSLTGLDLEGIVDSINANAVVMLKR